VKAQGSLGQCQSVILGILRHWIKYPDAKDACDGICKWWLPQDLANTGREKVQQALDILVSRGWVTERLSKSAETIYGLNAEKLEAIESFLREDG
jgi:hypothetical protein